MSLAETVAEIRRQGGLVYVPHPFDRMHAVPDYEHLLTILDEIDAIEIFNPRVAIALVQRGGRALRRQVPPDRRPPGPMRTSPPGLGSVRVRMRDFDGPERVPRVAARRRDPHAGRPACSTCRRSSSSRRRPRRRARGGRGGRGACAAPCASPDARLKDNPSGPGKLIRPMPATDDEIREKYLERAIRELNLLTRDIQGCEHCPRGALMPVLGLRPSAGRHHAAQVRAAPLGDRGGRRLLRPLRQRADEVAAAPGRSTRSRSTARCS